MISKSVKIVVVVLLGLACIGQIRKPANPPKAQPVAQPQPLAPEWTKELKAKFKEREDAKIEAQEQQEREAKWDAMNRGEISFCEAIKSDLQRVTGISKPCLSEDPTYRAVRDGVRDALRR